MTIFNGGYSKKRQLGRDEKIPLPKPKKPQCAICKKVFNKINELHQVCSVPCSEVFAKKNTARLEKESKKLAKAAKILQNKKDRRDRIELRSIGGWEKILQVEVNWIVRNIDKGYPCICHPNRYQFKPNAGHYFSRGSWPSLKFNFHNIHLQSVGSNQHKGGEPILFRRGLEARYGVDYFNNKVDTLTSMYPILKLTKFEIKETFLPRAKVIVSLIKKGETFDRDQLNDMLGIYTNQSKPNYI